MAPIRTELTAFALRARYEGAVLRSATWIGWRAESVWNACNSPSGCSNIPTRHCSSQAFVNEPWCAATRSASPSRRNSVPKLAWQIRVALFKIDLKTGSNSPGDELMTLRTSEAAESCSNASSRSRLSSAFFVLALDGSLHPLTFGALGRFVFEAVRRRFFMASSSAARVPVAAMSPPRRREYQETPAVS